MLKSLGVVKTSKSPAIQPLLKSKIVSDEPGSSETRVTHRPTKRLGQNFLRNPQVINRIIDAFAPKADETVIEIGPGMGALTTILIDRAACVIAVELDRDLAPMLREKFRTRPNFRLVEADA